MKRDQSGVSGVSWHMVYSFGAGALSAQVGVWRAIWGCCGDVTGRPGTCRGKPPPPVFVASELTGFPVAAQAIDSSPCWAHSTAQRPTPGPGPGPGPGPPLLRHGQGSQRRQARRLVRGPQDPPAGLPHPGRAGRRRARPRGVRPLAPFVMVTSATSSITREDNPENTILTRHLCHTQPTVPRKLTVTSTDTALPSKVRRSRDLDVAHAAHWQQPGWRAWPRLPVRAAGWGKAVCAVGACWVWSHR
jgi:hypothetical protein